MYVSVNYNTNLKPLLDQISTRKNIKRNYKSIYESAILQDTKQLNS